MNNPVTARSINATNTSTRREAGKKNKNPMDGQKNFFPDFSGAQKPCLNMPLRTIPEHINNTQFFILLSFSMRYKI